MPIARRLHQFDFLLLGSMLALAVIGLLAINSVASYGANPMFFYKQVLWLLLGVFVFLLFFLVVDYHFLTDHAFLLYLLTILVLIAVLLFGQEINGSRSWLRIGGIGLQPSELAKIVVILTLARYLSELKHDTLLKKDVLIVAGMTALPVILVEMQGDLGTALTYLPILLGTLLVTGLPTRFLVWVLILTLCLVPLGWFALQDYQQQRILVMFDPELDPHGVGYQTRQSLIAVGSGGLTGKGAGQALQSRLGFVPEIHSDFIFSLLSEERGLVGAGLALGLYLLAMLRLAQIGETARDRLGILIVAGIVGLLCFHVVVNVGMTVGLMPAVGIPLPLLSYGGSITLTTFAMLGLALNVHRRRFVHS